MRVFPVRLHAVLLTALALLAATAAPAGAQEITAPRAVFGFDIGDDYQLATYTQLERYWSLLADESPRMVLDTIGTTAEGRAQLMAIVTSPANHEALARYRAIAARLAHARDLTDAEASALAMEGKAVVWIDGGLHATEVLGAHQLMEIVHQLVSMNDPETLRILDDVIVLAVHANPDGMELVSEWYMREPDPRRRSSRGIPRLYQKYIGHDNNRDFYMVTQPETENMARVLFREWYPQIVYNHHQTGPEGTVMFAPPFRDPHNYNFDPLVPLGIDAVGAAMHGRFVAEGKGGTTMRSGASYSTWWNGGLRTTTYFHNMIGLLTETIGNPTPVQIPFRPDRQLASGDLPLPIEPQQWHFRQSIEYSTTANRAVLDYASRYREVLLYNIYRMGRNAIERGQRDHWTVQPRHIEAVEARAGEAVTAESSAWRSEAIRPELFSELRRPEDRDPRGFILPSDQVDFATAVKFANTLIKTGITVHEATEAFEVGARRYPAGSLVIRADQAFRAHVMDMFEPQDHPNDFAYPGGPPIRPYDNAGWTLAFQMGIAFDRVLEGFDGPFRQVEGFIGVPRGGIAGPANAVGYVASHRVNDVVILVNRVLAAGGAVWWVDEAATVDGHPMARGDVYIAADGVDRATLDGWAHGLGVTLQAVTSAPGAAGMRIRPARVALWDRYGGSMPSGWTRWLLEQFEFPFDVVYPPALSDGDLAAYDVIVFPDGAFERSYRSMQPADVPDAYRDRVGSLNAEQMAPRLRAFAEGGGTVITIGSASRVGEAVGLPLANHLTDEDGRSLRSDEYYIPGSVLRVAVDTTRPIAFGVPAELDVLFDESPVFRMTAERPELRAIARFTTDRPLRSGWAWGQARLEGGVAMAEASVGDGSMYFFGPEILYRGQPHGTFKFFFNGLHLARAERAAIPGGQ